MGLASTATKGRLIPKSQKINTFQCDLLVTALTHLHKHTAPDICQLTVLLLATHAEFVTSLSRGVCLRLQLSTLIIVEGSDDLWRFACGDVFDIFWQSLVILETCDIWDTDYNYDNWEPDFMTIFVTWQLRVTLDSIRNSCDILSICVSLLFSPS